MKSAIYSAIIVLFSLIFSSVYTLAQAPFTALEKAIIRAIHPDAPLPIILNNNLNGMRTLSTPSTNIDLQDPLLPELIHRLTRTVQVPENDGVGIAAPQIGINRNVFLAQRFDKENHPFECFINPSILYYSDTIQWGPEGCLSIPDLRDSVPRSSSVMIQYFDLNGNPKEEHISGFTAIIIQHEYDHLLGILFPQRIQEYKDQK